MGEAWGVSSLSPQGGPAGHSSRAEDSALVLFPDQDYNERVLSCAAALASHLKTGWLRKMTEWGWKELIGFQKRRLGRPQRAEGQLGKGLSSRNEPGY